MLKKKNIATMMAAATVATSVAPVFAATIVTETVKKGSDEQKALVNDLRKLLAEGTKFEVTHENALDTEENNTIKVGDSVYAIGYRKVNTTDSTVTLVDNVLQLEKEIEKLKKDEFLNVVVYDKGHATVNGKISPVNAKKQDIKAEQLAEITVDNTVSVVKEYDIADFYDGEYVTADGLELANLILAETRDENKYSSIKNTVSSIKPLNKEHSFTVKFDVKYVDTAKKDASFTIRISGKDLADVKELHDYLTGVKEIGASKLVGETRFETAVAIANESHKTTASNIVLVNATSMIDGLTASPLAAKLNAAVLLTNTDELPQATLDYIKQSKKLNGKTSVTIIGGTGVVSDKVKSQLQAMGVEVERIGGVDRHATSVEVAIKLEKMHGTKLEKAFVVAATGEADAMSIAPVAAKMDEDKKVTPIIVEGFDGMSTTADELLKSAQDIAVIGGKVSKETQETYKDRKKYDFVAGEDRFETNAKIVRNYFKKGDVKSIYVAKDGYTENNNEVLVDALAVGTLAADKNAAIILASEKLTTKQEEAVQLVSTEYVVEENGIDNIEDATTVTQVGGGLKHAVVKQIAKILGYTNK